MFGFGCAIALIGYAATYVSVYRLGGDTRTVYSIVMGANGGKPIGKKAAAQTGAQINTNAALSTGKILAGAATGNLGDIGTVIKDDANFYGGVLSKLNPFG